MKRGLPEILQSFQTCITFLRSIGDSLQDYTEELKATRRSAWELVLEFEGLGNSARECATELQCLKGPLEECKALLHNAGFPLRGAAEGSEPFESEVPFVSYEIINKRAKEFSK